MRHYVLLLFVSPVSFLHGQNLVMLPTGFAPVDISVIEAANQTLQAASASSGFDIKMAFLTSLPGADGRYEEYKRLDPNYLEFLRTPASSAYSSDAPDATAEHNRLVRKGVELLNVAENRSLTIIYTTVITLSATGVLHDQKKTVYYGRGFSDCDKRRFEQIEDFTGKPTDFCVKSAAAENNAYVAWYSARLAEATGDDYVITGSISFNGNIYCEPTELYINDQHNSVLTATSDFHPPIRLMVHPESVVPTVSWSCPTSSATLFTLATGAFNTLNFQPAAFEQFNELIADWGDGRRSSISVLPVNFQVEVDEQLLEQQGNDIEEITYEYKNNHTNFPVRDNIIINLIGPTNVAGAPREETILPTESGASFSWTPNEEECDPHNFEHILLANTQGLTEESSITSFKLKCVFKIKDFIVSAPYTMDTKSFGGSSSPIQREASANEGESLYIVSNYLNNLEDLKREVKAKIIWEGMNIPEAEDYWKQDPIVSTTFEPLWIGSPEYIYEPIYGFAQKDKFTVEYQPVVFHTPPTHGVIILPPLNTTDAQAVFDELFLPVDQKLGKAEVTVFDQNKYVALYFIHREERRIDGEEIAPQDLVDIKEIVNTANEFLSALDTWTLGLIPNGLSGSANLRTIVFNQEDPASNLFYQNIKSTITGGITIDIPTSGDYWMVPGFSFNIPFVGGAGLGFKCSIGLAANFDWTMKRRIDMTFSGNFQDLPIGKKFSGLTPTFTGRGGVVIDVDTSVDFLELEGGAVAEANIEFDPVEWARNPVTNKMEVKISGDFMPMHFIGYFEVSIDVFGYDWNPFDEEDTSVDILDLWPAVPYPFEWKLIIP